jgi:hypothetical protein
LNEVFVEKHPTYFGEYFQGNPPLVKFTHRALHRLRKENAANANLLFENCSLKFLHTL